MKTIFVFITRELTPQIEKKLRSILNAGIDAYIMCDTEPSKKSKRILYYSDSDMEEIGWTHHMSQEKNRITAWDKATYFAYTTKCDYAWFCEDDVYWNKISVIKHLFENAGDADLVANKILQRYEDKPNWWHWPKAELLTKQKKYWTATYNQICRVSRSILNKMGELSEKKHRLFFHEVMFAIIANMNGYSIKYITDMNISVFTSIRWDKPFTEEQVQQAVSQHKLVLLHPVKIEL